MSGRRAALTPEREALIRRFWLEASVSVPEILAAVNALPGWRYGNPASLYEVAARLGLPRQRPAPPVSRRQPWPKPPPGAPRVQMLSNKPRPVREEDVLEARAMLLAGRSVVDVAEWFGWTLDEAREVARALAAERQARRAAG